MRPRMCRRRRPPSRSDLRATPSMRQGRTAGRRRARAAPQRITHASSRDRPPRAHEFGERERRDLRGLDLAAAAPEDVGVADRRCRLRADARRSRPCARARLLVEPVRDAHDVDVAELRAALAPVGVRHDVVAPDLAPGVDLAARRHRPVEERVVARDAFAGLIGLDVLEKRRETPDHAALVERLRPIRSERRRARRRLRPPARATDRARSRGRELALERVEDAPLERARARRCACRARRPAPRRANPAPGRAGGRARRRARRAASPASCGTLGADARARNSACFSSA
jgi:hypothetical protein